MTAGVYQIVNVLNGKCYVGSSKDVYARMYEHRRLLRNGKHHSVALQRSWRKYGEDKFIFRMVEEVELSSLISSEQHWLSMLIGHYNMCPVAGSRLGVKHTLETRRKLSAARLGKKLSDEHIEKVAKAQRGKKHSMEWRHNISIGLLGKKHTPERVAKLLGNKRGTGRRSDAARRNMSIAAKLRWAKQALPAAVEPGERAASVRAI